MTKEQVITDFVGVLRTAGVLLFGYVLGLSLLKKYDKPKVNSELCQAGKVYVDPSGFAVHNSVKYSGRG